MLLSAFGFPLPEELILVSSGLIAYMSRDPQRYPPPYPEAPHINVYYLAAIAFIAVISSDCLIFAIGQRLGPRLFRLPWFRRLIPDTRLEKIQRWMWNYGYWAVFVFRFTPGIRFPGHLTCGALKLSKWKFLFVDSFAAGISVPTQILLVAFYGHPILHYIGRFRLFCLSLVFSAVLIYVLGKIIQQKRTSQNRPINS
jgi:membrane protein DedA with SNARE-associated domain